MTLRAKQLKIAGITFLSLIGLLLLTGFLSRNLLLNHFISSRINNTEATGGMYVHIASARFSGISTIKINRLSVTPPQGDTLLKINEIRVNVNPVSLIFLKLRFGYVEIKNPQLQLVRNGTESNYLFLLKKETDTVQKSDTTTVPLNFKYLTDRIFSLIFNYIPSNILIENAGATAAIDGHYISAKMNQLLIEDREFNTKIFILEDSVANQWELKGEISPADRQMGFSLSTSGIAPVKMPYLQHRWGFLLAFDTLQLDVKYLAESDSTSVITGYARAKNQVINHSRISDRDVLLETGEASFVLRAGNHFAEIDSLTQITYNQQSFRMFARYDNSPEKRIRFRIHEPDFDAGTFFSSLPEGLFNNLRGIKVKGRLSFHLNLDLNQELPDSLVFTSALKSKDFSIQEYGNTNFTYINQEFAYTAFEKGKAVRTFMVGPSNPDFRPLQAIPQRLQYAIMTSEDGAFFYHRGFLPDAIRESLIKNIKERRFARGGSTISMQLVKNVFLTRNKNITRKVEEMLITWLIESERLVSKERMMEVYLNVIETGPMVYGVNEAAHFYFAKDVSKLTLAESIFIASIVPKPKWFKYSFDSDGQLREHMKAYYELVSGKMLGKGWITEQEHQALLPVVELKGPARNLVILSDSIPADFEEDME